MKNKFKGLLIAFVGFLPLLGNAQTFPVNNLTVSGSSTFNGAASFAGPSTFSVSPTAPTPVPGDSSTKLATTAFVQNGLSNVFPNVPAGQLYGGTGVVGVATAVKVPSYWAQSYGVRCDNSTNDTTALQNLVNSAIASGGGTVILPSGTCLIPGGLTENLSGYSGDIKPYVNIQGQGVTSTTLQVNGLAGPAINIIGSSSNDISYLNLSDFALFGSSTGGSIGLQTADTAFLRLRNIIVQGFITGWSASDLEQSSIEHASFRFNGNGIVLNGAVNATGSNSLSFYDVTIGNNSSSGILVKNFAAVSFFNGSIQYNGSTGVSGEHGALFEDTAGGNTCGYNTVSFYGTVFEGNGGDYDIDMANSYCPGAALTLNAVSFLRSSSYSTSNIRMDGTQPQTVTLTGSTFVYNSFYTPNSSHPNVNLANNSSAVVYDNGSNFFQSAIEGPLYPQAQIGWPAGANGEWATYTPVLACGSGTLTTASATGRYKYLGKKTVAIQVTLNISNAGSCTAGVFMTLPSGVTVNSSGNIYPISAIDVNTGGLASATVYYNSGQNDVELNGTPSAHVYNASGIFETP